MSIYFDNYLHDTWQTTLRPEIWLLGIQLSSQVHELLLSILTKTTSLQAVWIGDLELFRNVAEKFSNTFNSNQTHKLEKKNFYKVKCSTFSQARKRALIALPFLEWVGPVGWSMPVICKLVIGILLLRISWYSPWFKTLCWEDI